MDIRVFGLILVCVYLICTSSAKVKDSLERKLSSPITSNSNKYYENNKSNNNNWDSVLVVNKTCPRFLYIDTRHEGLGDQLECLFVGLSLAYKNRNASITMVVEDTFGHTSNHLKEGYRDIFHNVLGIPRKLLNITTVRQLYHPKEIGIGYHDEYGEYLNGKRNLDVSLACDTLISVDVYDSCHGWCPFHWSEEMQRILKPLLRTTLFHTPTCFNSIQPPLLPHVINVVWHVRSGDICLHCADSDDQYYRKVQSFLSLVLAGLPHQSIVVHLPTFSHRIPSLFKSVSNVTLFASENVTHAVCNFLNADILIATGSSFPALVSWFTPHYRPLIFEEQRNAANKFNSKYQYAIAPEDALRLSDGTLVSNVTVAETLAILQHNGVIQRVMKYEK